MTLKNEFIKTVTGLSTRFTIPRITDVFLPPFRLGGQPKNAMFIAITLEGGATGISYILLTDEKMDAHNALSPRDFAGKNPVECALEFGY